MDSIKPYLRYIIGIGCLIGGIVFMFIPFIPLGYLLLFAALLLLAPKIPFLKKWVRLLKQKDKKGRLQSIENKIEEWEDDENFNSNNKNTN